jgi:hypothetical protein
MPTFVLSREAAAARPGSGRHNIRWQRRVSHGVCTVGGATDRVREYDPNRPIGPESAVEKNA